MASADLIVHSRQPFNAEPPLHRLRASFLTPQDVLYVRSHGDVPHLDAATHAITVAGQVASPLRLRVAELQAGFAHRSVTAVLQCAGNRRADLHRVAPVCGDPWAGGAIGNAEWTGVALADVLQAAGAATGDRHVVFDAADQVTADGKTFAYGASIPMAKALSPEVLLAWAVNGQTLTPEHGYPLRVVVPGFAGVRSPKWLSAITVQDTPSDNPMQAADYKLYPPGVTMATADPAKGITINEMPVNATICEPARLAVLPKGLVTVRGYATATARAVVRVDVSADGGHTWQQAQLEAATPWSWTLWSIVLDLPPGDHALAVRAWDAAGQTQPGCAEDVWNYRGYLSTAWHRVPVHVQD
jgi:sulfite oxidase